MFYIACTRFNNNTYRENTEYRAKHKINAIYGPAFKIREMYPSGCLIFIAEMNNETNKIEGIGLIRNNLAYDKTYKIYQNGDYNRYIYRGNYWIGRDDLLTLNPEMVETLDTILFKGKSHMKIGSGISVLTAKIFTHWIYELNDLKTQVKTAFLVHFRNAEIAELWRTEKLAEKLEDAEIITEK